MTRIKGHHLRISRDTILFVTGLAGVAYETLVTKADRPTLLLLFAAMIGLPAFLRADEHNPPPPPPPTPIDRGANADV